jgi:uncharacterized UPF0160 family protein
MKKIIVHDGQFHADDVFATATIQLILTGRGDESEVIRTRDEEVIGGGDYVLDVGGIYDPETFRFDHHQDTFKEMGYLGVGYSSFGLVWKHLGRELCGNERVWGKIRNEFVTLIDAVDNGVAVAKEVIVGLSPLSPGDMVTTFRPLQSSRNPESQLEGFLEAVEYAKGYLTRLITREIEKDEAREEVIMVLSDPQNTITVGRMKVLVLPKPLPWGEVVDQEKTDLDFVLFPRENGDWMARGVEPVKGLMGVKVVKSEWGGLRDVALSEKAGVPDLIFYHKTGYILVGKTFESILSALAKF